MSEPQAILARESPLQPRPEIHDLELEKRRRREQYRRRRGRVFALALNAIAPIFERLPLGAVQRLGALGGQAAYLWLGRSRRRALGNLAFAFGPGREREHRRIARACFANVGRNLAELLVVRRIGVRQLVTMRGVEHLEAALSHGRGTIAITGHIGSWELLAAAIADRGFSLTVVGRKPHEPALFEMLESLRRGYGVETLWRDTLGAAKQILKTLRRNSMLGMLIDQDTTRVPQVIVPFFGRPARTPSGAATLARRTGAPLVCVYIRRTASGHEVEFEPPVDPMSFPGETAVTDITAALSRSIEARIRARPEDWVWWHRRWRV